MVQSLNQINEELKKLQGKEVVVHHRYGWQKIILFPASLGVKGKNHFCLFNSTDVRTISGIDIWLY